MRKKTLGIFVSLLAVVILTLPIPLMYAKSPKFMTVDGFIFGTGAPSAKNLRLAGNSGNAILTVTAPVGWSGGITGNGELNALWIYQKFGTPEQKVSDHVVWTLEATVDDKEGMLTLKGDKGTWRIIGGTDELVNLHGQGTYWMINPATLTLEYTGTVHFDP